MKKSTGLIAGIILAVMLVNFAGAVCSLGATLLNQDPYPANPDEYVKVVFKVNGTESPDCADSYFEIVQSYPFSVDENARTMVKSGYYVKDYPDYVLVPYKIRVDENAIDGDTIIKARYGSLTSESAAEQDFIINVEETKTDFDVIVQDYAPSTNTITFAIVNIGKKDAEALTFEIPEQGNVKLVGNNKVVIGSLDTNDDTTTTIVAEPRGAGEFLVRLNYNDENSVRRTVNKNVSISDALLRKQEASTTAKGTYFYLFWLIILAFAAYYAYRYYQRKRQKNNKAFLLMKSRLK